MKRELSKMENIFEKLPKGIRKIKRAWKNSYRNRENNKCHMFLRKRDCFSLIPPSSICEGRMLGKSRNRQGEPSDHDAIATLEKKERKKGILDRMRRVKHSSKKALATLMRSPRARAPSEESNILQERASPRTPFKLSHQLGAPQGKCGFWVNSYMLVPGISQQCFPQQNIWEAHFYGCQNEGKHYFKR